jgi:hypothetical protein
MGNFLKRLLFFLFIIGLVLGLAYYCSNRIEEKRIEDRGRNEKLDYRTCEFDTLDLSEFRLHYFEKSFKPTVHLDTLSVRFSDYIAKAGINKADTSSALKNFSIGSNTLFVYFQVGEYAVLNSIELNRSSEFRFMVKGEELFSPQTTLSDLKERFPKSYACRINEDRSLAAVDYYIRIENSGSSGNLRSIILYFDYTENLKYIVFETDPTGNYQVGI